MASRWVNCPPVETCRTHADQASPALSSSVADDRAERCVAAARVSSPPVTSSSGFARRVIAIRAPGGDHPGDGDRGGDRQQPLLHVRRRRARRPGSGRGSAATRWPCSSTIHRTPSVIAWAIPLSTSPVALRGHRLDDVAGDAGRVGQGVAGHGLTSRSGRSCNRTGRRPGGRGTGPVAAGRGDHAPVTARQRTAMRVTASTVVPLLAGPSVTMSDRRRTAACRLANR